jgi:hypothetical protein
MVEPPTQKISSKESAAELGGIDKLRLKLRPLLLYVVSTAQFIDIGKSYHSSSGCPIGWE